MKIDPNSRADLSAQIATALRDAIVSGELIVDARLPSEAELAEHFQVSRPTVREALKALTADGIVVSNHGGRQLDGTPSTARALPAIADAVKGDLKILVDSGIRTGLDVVRMLALGADCTMLGRAYIYALAAGGQAGVHNLLELIEKEMRVAMVLTGAKTISDINADLLVPGV